MPTHYPKIVFVLGAGASAEYGLPVADRLRSSVIESPPTVNAQPDRFDDDLVTSYMQSFAAAMDGAGASSIDQFVEWQPAFRSQAEIAISHSLLTASLSATRSLTDANRWYAWLFHHICKPGLKPQFRDVGIVTFNYDLTLEFALRRMRMNTLGLNDPHDCGEIEEMRIVHVYGKLDRADPTESILPQWLQGGLKYHPQLVHELTKGLRLTGDLREGATTPLLDEARELLWNATRVVFMGFAYDDVNMRRIGTHREFKREWADRGVQLFLCGCGIEGQTRKDVLHRIGRGVSSHYFGHEDMKGGAWLKQTVLLRNLLAE